MITALVIAFGSSGGAEAKSSSADSRAQGYLTATRATPPESCPYARLGVVYYRSRYTHWQLARGASVPSWRQPRNCADARYLATVWAKRSFISRQQTARWLEWRTLRDFVVRDGNNAWLRAVTEAQKVFPGTAWWLKSCSSTEGGWGKWVPNSDGAPPGGWMQMYESTFWRMWRTAKAHAQTHGFRVPRSAASWYSPLGQPLASAWGLTFGRRGEWSSSGC